MSRAALLTLFLVSLPGASAAAGPYPVLSRVAGKPVRLLFSDGRVARLEISEPAPFTVKVPLEVTEAVCSTPRPKVKCELRNPVEFTGFRLVWAKPGRKAKAGAVLIGTERQPLTNDDLWTLGVAGVYPKVVSDLPPLDLICDDFSWLVGGEGKASAPERADLASWSSELMREDQETEQTINMAVGAAYGMHFKRVDDRTLRLRAVDHWTGKDGKTTQRFFMVGDVVSVVVLEPSGAPCQLTLKPGFQAGLDEAHDREPGLARTWRPLVEGRDSGKYDISNTKGFFTYQVTHEQEGEFE